MTHDILQAFVLDPRTDRYHVRRSASPHTAHCDTVLPHFWTSPSPNDPSHTLTPNQVCPKCLAVLRALGNTLYAPPSSRLLGISFPTYAPAPQPAPQEANSANTPTLA